MLFYFILFCFVFPLLYFRLISEIPIFLLAEFIHQDRDLQEVLNRISASLKEIKKDLKFYEDLSRLSKYLHSLWLDSKVTSWNNELDKMRFLFFSFRFVSFLFFF